MSTDENNLEELNAYLDGELESSDRRRVEDRLASDPAYHQELRRLERAWNLLDCLEQTPVDASFTQSTLSMITLAAAEDLEEERSTRPARTRRQRMILAGTALAACLVGYIAGRAIWPDTNEALLRDLPVIQNLDLYRQVGDIEFLRKLDEQRSFAEEVDHAE